MALGQLLFLSENCLNEVFGHAVGTEFGSVGKKKKERAQRNRDKHIQTVRDSKTNRCPNWVAQLVRASSQYAKVVGSIPGQDIYKNQPMNA